MIAQVIISAFLILLILVQSKDEGFSSTGAHGLRIVRRGPEKVVFITTIVMTALFLIASLLFVFV